MRNSTNRVIDLLTLWLCQCRHGVKKIDAVNSLKIILELHV